MTLRLLILVLVVTLGVVPPARSADRPACGTHLLPNAPGLPKPVRQLQSNRPFSVGDTLTVSAFSFRLVGGGHYLTTTTCRSVTTNSYIFVEDEIWGTSDVTQERLEGIAEAFDRSTPADPDRGIYNLEVELFGPPPDVDDDPRVLIVVLDILDSSGITGITFVGYFDTDNQSPPVQTEILYLDSASLEQTGILARATLAHEFQHMIHWAADPDEEKWVDEGCSEYAELACGYKDTSETAAEAYLAVPNISLTEWGDNAFDFDQVFLWMTYFVQRHGEDALPLLVGRLENGIQGVELAMSASGSARTFQDHFSDWMAATYLDAPGSLGYERVDLGRVYRDSISVPAAAGNRIVRLWGTDYLALGAGSGVGVEIESTGDNDLMVALITDRNGSPTSVDIRIPAGTGRRIGSFGSATRALAVTRTSGTDEFYTFGVELLDGSSAAAADFDTSGLVDFTDFLAFASHYAQSVEQPDYDPSYDLDGSRDIGFSDFLIFARNFGKWP